MLQDRTLPLEPFKSLEILFEPGMLPGEAA